MLGRARRRDTGATRGARRRVPVAGHVVVAAALALVFVVADHGAWRWRHSVGLLLLLPGSVTWTLARRALDDAFTTRAEARTLVTSGPYTYLRHPIYISAECISAGTLIFLGQFWVLLAVALVGIPVQVWRARREEQVLEAAFGDDYRAYRDRTWC